MVNFDGESGLYGLQRKLNLREGSCTSEVSDNILVAEMRDSVDGYLRNASTSGVRSLADIIQYNKEHPDQQAGIGGNTKVSCPLT